MIDKILQPDWLTLAQTQIGTHEIAGAKHNPQILEYHKTTKLKATTDEIAWCSAFVNWCITKSHKVGTDSAAARSWLSWGQPLKMPQLGCVVVLKRGKNPAQGHVGFYVGGTAGKNLKILGGNQGDQVCIQTFPENLAIGYRWPKI